MKNAEVFLIIYFTTVRYMVMIELGICEPDIASAAAKVTFY